MPTNNYHESGTPSREPGIPSALDELLKEIEMMGAISEQVTMRLEKVCSPSAPTPNEMSKPESTPARAEYVENLRGKARQIRCIRESLENTLNRLEL